MKIFDSIRCTNKVLYIHILCLIILFPFFFIDLPFDKYSRSANALWDLGHIIFFMLFVRILAKCQKVNNVDLIWATKILLSVFFIGVFIEIFQSGIAGHLSSWKDVLRNMSGGIIGLISVFWTITARKQRILLLLILLSLITINSIPIGHALLDEMRSKRDFPILSSFETAGELSRWHAKTEITRVKNPVRQGRFALRLPLSTHPYSGISLKFFPGNWSGMSGIKLSVYNPEPEGIKITFRIHDRQHAQGEQLYSDRFNYSIFLLFGWNDFYISMKDIKNAPKNRSMDLKNIYNFSLFAHNLKEKQVIYIDDVKLVQ